MALDVQNKDSLLLNNNSLGDHGANSGGLITLDLFNTKTNKSSSSFSFEAQDQIKFIITKEKKCLEKHLIINMNQRMNENSSFNMQPPELDLRLNLYPPRPTTPTNGGVGGVRWQQPIFMGPESPNQPASLSPPSSCISELNDVDQLPVVKWSSVPDVIPLILVGCPRCFMYVMLPKNDIKCPRCKSTALIDIVQEAAATAANFAAVSKRARMF